MAHGPNDQLVDDREFWCNFEAYKQKGLKYPGISEMTNPAHLLWFPRIPKVNSTEFKIRCTFMMTTSAKFRLYAKFPVHSDYAYETVECYLGQFYQNNTY